MPAAPVAVALACFWWCAMASAKRPPPGTTGEPWPLERPDGMPQIQSLEVMCGKDHMDVHLSFSRPFEGVVSSKGQHGDPRCVYVPPATGATAFSFRIAYQRCGTKPDLHGQFYENTVVVQYDKDLLEVWDEAKRLRCEWFNDYEKTASKPPMVIADLDVVQLDFRGDNVDCWMEIQHGKGPWAPPVSGIVPLGSTLTLVVAINDKRGEFDMRVKSCLAGDGGAHAIQLSDEAGCVLRPNMISRFLKARGADDRATVLTYAFFHAFKFPDALSVHVRCKVEICRHGCLDHCQLGPEQQPATADLDLNLDLGQYAAALDRKDDELVADADEDDAVTAAPHKADNDSFPHGPRAFERRPPSGAPRELRNSTRRRRNLVVPPSSGTSDVDVGVSGIYEVISEADLAFSPADGRAEAVAVFQGRIREEVVYGICMPVPGFSLLFVLVGAAAAASALVAGALLYRYQLQREGAAKGGRLGRTRHS